MEEPIRREQRKKQAGEGTINGVNFLLNEIFKYLRKGRPNKKQCFQQNCPLNLCFDWIHVNNWREKKKNDILNIEGGLPFTVKILFFLGQQGSCRVLPASKKMQTSILIRLFSENS